MVFAIGVGVNADDGIMAGPRRGFIGRRSTGRDRGESHIQGGEETELRPVLGGEWGGADCLKIGADLPIIFSRFSAGGDDGGDGFVFVEGQCLSPLLCVTITWVSGIVKWRTPRSFRPFRRRVHGLRGLPTLDFRDKLFPTFRVDAFLWKRGRAGPAAS